MNKLKQNLFIKKSWGSEIVWVLTNGYMAKTIEIDEGCKTPLIVHKQKEKSIIVIYGELFLTYGDGYDIEKASNYKLPTGWSWHIEPGKFCSYASLKGVVRLVEVSSPQLEEGITIIDEDGIKFKATDLEESIIDEKIKKSKLAKLKEKEYKNDRNK
jgi:hypothetical protein